MKIVYFGGTFDPPTLGHYWMVKTVMENMTIDICFVQPCPTPGHRREKGMPSASIQQRYEMCKLQFEGPQGISKTLVTDLEPRNQDITYTYETLEKLHRQFPSDEIWVLMGADELHEFPMWKEPLLILSFANLVVIDRHGYDVSRTLIEGKLRNQVRVLHSIEGHEISASEIRHNLKQHESWLHIDVKDYIKQNHLYVRN